MSRSSRTFPKISFHGVKNRILREHQKADSQSAHRAEFLVGTTQFANPARMRKPRDCKSPGASPRAEFCLTQIACRLRLHGVGQYSAKVSRQILNSVVSFQNGCFGGSWVRSLLHTASRFQLSHTGESETEFYASTIRILGFGQIYGDQFAILILLTPRVE